MVEIIEHMQWKNYFFRKGEEFKIFWKDYLTSDKRNICYIMGLGFDPRMCSAIDFIIDCNGEGLRDCILIEFNEGENSPSKKYQTEIDNNLRDLESILSKKGHLDRKEIGMISESRRRIGGRNIVSIFNDMEIKKYSDIIIDISALPRPLYFPLIKLLIERYNREIKGSGNRLNIHVIVVENPKLDSSIKALGIEDKGEYIFGFGGEIELESTETMPKVWIPILGEGKEIQIKTIHTLIKPQETCPILPFPATNPRRGDDIVLEYRKLLFDDFRIDPVNLLYASEQNPFEVYRKIIRTVSQYYRTLHILGGCKIIVSVLSSKLLSIGALLAVYDISENSDIPIGIAHVENQGYEILPYNKADVKRHEEFYSLWLAGECYEGQ